MKKQHFIFMALACICTVFNAIAQNTPIDNFLKKYPSTEGVTHISMSQQMLQTIFASSPSAVPEAYTSLTISEKNISENYYTDFTKTLLAASYELFMEIKMENNQRMSYFIKKLNVHNRETVVLRQQKDYFSSIYIKGDIDIDDLDVYLKQIRTHLLNFNEAGTELTQDLMPQTPQPVRPPPPPVPPVNPNYPQASITVENARKTALASTGGGTVVRVETKTPPHGMEYKVVIVNGDNRYDVHISANRGNVVNTHVEQITKVAPHARAHSTAGVIGVEKAKSIAQKAVGGGIITDCHLDYPPHLGALTYHIHVGNGQYEYCVELYATSGVVFKVEQRYKP
jgi:uncharacterized membrane protein YkoI